VDEQIFCHEVKLVLVLTGEVGIETSLNRELNSSQSFWHFRPNFLNSPGESVYADVMRREVDH